MNYELNKSLHWNYDKEKNIVTVFSSNNYLRKELRVENLELLEKLEVVVNEYI